MKEKNQKSHDDIFLEENIEKQFQFDDRVASVFDDMLERSVPFYRENIALIVSILSKYLESGDRALDLGCSTASLLLQIEKNIPNLELLGIDNSEPMLKQAQKKIEAFGSKIELHFGDMLEFQIPNSKAVILNYTLQFIRPPKREEVLKKIFDSLESGGVLILSEKVIFENPKLNRNLIDIYYSFKKENGYSQYEIAQKREALENILIPYSEKENRELLKKSGFESIETVFQWGNFQTFLAFKE